jgi:transcription antitermination factor NusG
MSWFVAVADYARQKQAVDLLSDMNFSAYAPTFLKTIVRNGVKFETSRFLFGRYFFILMREGWEAIVGLRNVTQILLSPELRPLLVCDEIISEIRSREIGGVIRTNEGLRRGQLVMPRVGHLAGVEGRFWRADKHRDVALFNILGVETRVDFAPGVLEVLDPILEFDKKKRRHRQRCTGDRVTRPSMA